MLLRAAVYARYSSENQRPESIEDQVAACRVAAGEMGLVILEDHIYTDSAMSGAVAQRPALAALREAVPKGLFDVLLLDDLSRLARDNALMQILLNDLDYEGIRVVSVADHLDTADENAVLGVQIRGVFNELMLADLRKKTFRGLLGQKRRGFFVAEAAFGYRSVASGKLSLDKHGRSRPEGYTMRIVPAEAETVLRIFRECADGVPYTRIAKSLNKDLVPGRFRSSKGWTIGSVHRILANTKYRGHWIWNKSGQAPRPQDWQIPALHEAGVPVVRRRRRGSPHRSAGSLGSCRRASHSVSGRLARCWPARFQRWPALSCRSVSSPICFPGRWSAATAGAASVSFPACTAATMAAALLRAARATTVSTSAAALRRTSFSRLFAIVSSSRSPSAAFLTASVRRSLSCAGRFRRCFVRRLQSLLRSGAALRGLSPSWPRGVLVIAQLLLRLLLRTRRRRLASPRRSMPLRLPWIRL